MLLNKYYDWQVIKELDFSNFYNLFFCAQKKEIEEKALPFWELSMFVNAISHQTEEIVTFDKFLQNIEDEMFYKKQQSKKDINQIRQKYESIAENYRKQKGGKNG